MNLFDEFNYIPDGLLKLKANELHQWLPRPTLFHLKGKKPEYLFVSVLLHGNEVTGWEAMRTLLSQQQLTRGILLFIGNIKAAKHSLRKLPDQQDHNRIWHDCATEECKMATALIKRIKYFNIFASVDIHNNTGINPHYACVTDLEEHHLQLAVLFSRTVVFFTSPQEVLCRATSPISPAVTIEAGKTGEQHGVSHTIEYIESLLHIDHLPDRPPVEQDIEILESKATVYVPETASFSFDNSVSDINFRSDLDCLNFSYLEKGTVIGETKNKTTLKVIDKSKKIVTNEYFDIHKDKIVLNKNCILSMLTHDETIIRQDCLGYIMEPLVR